MLMRCTASCVPGADLFRSLYIELMKCVNQVFFNYDMRRYKLCKRA